LPKNGDIRFAESLSAHSSLVNSYANYIADKQYIKPIISNLIDKSIPKLLSEKQLLAKEIEILFWQAIAFHDLGKVNKEFQQKRMKNNANVLEVNHCFESQHSIISVYIFLANFWSKLQRLRLNDEDTIYICNIALYFSYSIYKHHSSDLYQAQDDNCWSNVDLFDLKPYISLFNILLDDEQIEQFHTCYLQNADFNFLFDRFNTVIFEKENSFPLFALLKLNYSLLTASDYLATAHFMNGWKEMLTDFGVIDDRLKEKIIFSAENSKPYNKIVYDSLNNNETINPDNYRERTNDNLNTLRKSIAMEVVTNIRQNADKHLFYIEAPTGGGKTNVSMLALAELLRADKNNSINKVFYVFPFTTLITQTYKSLSETLDLTETELVEIHSKAASSKGRYEEDYKNYLDNLFMNYPVTTLSHIKFFEVLKTNQKDSNYLLHRMANSVVIIDEIQSYSPSIWDKIIYFVVNYAKYFNMKFIIMSATLPKIGDIIDNKYLTSDFVYLIKDKKKYFQNPNFCNRVQFDYSLLNSQRPAKECRTDYLLNLKDIVFDKSKEYSDNNIKNSNSVFTIIEFIFKKTASEFYDISINDNSFFDEVYLLSGTILEARRNEIINNLKSEENRSKKILLISTQVVEAGVDIDMDLGFKDKSLIDSEEQLAGRINRNVKKVNCKLFLFDCDAEKSLYGGDERYKIMNQLGDEYKELLINKNFDKIYKLVINKIKENNNCPYIVNLENLKEEISTLNYKKVDEELQIIKSKNSSIFVPLDIPINYFKPYMNIMDELRIPYGEYLSGADVWNLYKWIILNGNEDFVQKRIKMKKLQGLMSNFIFSVFPNGKDYESLRTYGQKEYGFLYLENYKDVYSFENGINTEELQDSNFI
jgi:CRISPR-associated endonuclease/helicase Cas3